MQGRQLLSCSLAVTGGVALGEFYNLFFTVTLDYFIPFTPTIFGLQHTWIVNHANVIDKNTALER